MVIVSGNRIVPEDHPRFNETIQEFVGVKVNETLVKYLRERQGTRKVLVPIAENGQFTNAFGQEIQKAITLGNRGDISFPPLQPLSLIRLTQSICSELGSYLNSGAWPLAEEMIPRVDSNQIRFELRPYPLI